ncbi:ABC transporter substrate-binding protein [Cellulomonas chengniuliangii]|uniref:ABC transporter substrate-binding protein n=1 Tax=Cellulomonas chengniuliangii TaxID=2968084 RepID=A0ABY5KUR1_9CELL|nr:ABC transporter substrate-binding protein [Cellulomonas chengniuliangii]MCC2309001.1 ABC transporter substrate-binding protein [Cellulomonas chengniuliangii]UUI74266.1 ABC transporter substrate-binding protein [Cellulomonas chengniuliangii]
MNTATRLVPLGLAALLTLTACGSSEQAASDSGVPLVSEGQLTVCVNPPFEPFAYTDESGEVVGLDLDVVGEVAKDLGVELSTKVAAFETMQSGTDLDTGSCDVVASGMTITPEREAKLDFSEPYFDADQGLLVAAGSGITGVDGLAGKTVAVQQATTGETWAEENGLSVVQFEELGLQIKALETGQVDAVVNDIAVLGPYAAGDLEVAATFPTGEQYGIGVKTGNTALLDAVNATLDRIREDGTYDAIYTARIGTAPSTAPAEG